MSTLIYQIWPISWIEPEYEGDKRSALEKITDFLPRIKRLVANYVWLSPIYPSPWADHGYDVSNYYTIDPRLGTMEEFENLIRTAKALGLEILMDMVLNHTSTTHPWFKHPEYYCWSNTDKPDWHNLFDGKSCWELRDSRHDLYLHLFDKSQADLNWFPDGVTGEPNKELVKEFQKIVDFWTDKGVAGFRLDAMQCINKDPRQSYFSPVETATEHFRVLAKKVIDAVFSGKRSKLYLLMECLDINEELVAYYYENTAIDAVMDNMPVNTVKDITDNESVTNRSLNDYIAAVQAAYNRCPRGYAHVMESHDCPRFTTAAGVDGKEAIGILFGVVNDAEVRFSPQTIVVYQGQELGLQNPSKDELTDEMMLALDAQAKRRFEAGESLDDLRPTSRANARVKIPMDEYERQEKDDSSCLAEFILRSKLRDGIF